VLALEDVAEIAAALESFLDQRRSRLREAPTLILGELLDHIDHADAESHPLKF
jgi:hypothetical protein